MAQPLDNLTRTWTSGATESGIKLSVTDPGAAAASNLLELRGGAAGTTSLFSVRKDGYVVSAFGFGANNYYSSGGGLLASAVTGGFSLGSQLVIGSDVVMTRDAADILAQRRTTNPQAFRIYNTFTDTLNNFERGKIAWESNVLRIGTEKGLTAGTARALELQTDGTTRLVVSSTESRLGFGGLDANNPGIYRSGNTSFWFINGTNSTFCTVDAGTFASRTGAFLFVNYGRIDSTVDGVIKVANNANNDFGRLQFGGTTSSFPALKRSTTSLQARLADDSAFTNIQGKLTADVNAVAETPTATHTITIYDAAGTGYKVLCVAA